MPVQIDVRLDGAQNVVGNLRRVRRQAGRRIVVPATKKVAEDAAASARRTRSFKDRSRKLRRSIRIAQVRNVRGRFREGWVIIAGGITRGVIYAPFIEFGTKTATGEQRIRPRNFIRNALRRQRAKALRTMQRVASRGLDRLT